MLFRVFSGFDASIGGPEREASLVRVQCTWQHLNPLNHRQMVIFGGADVL